MIEHQPRTPARRPALLDTPGRYGLVSRLFHWTIAGLVLWQVFTILAWRFLGPTDFVKAVTSLGPYHGTVGVLTVALAGLRALWAVGFRHRRPRYETGVAGRAARLAHLALCGLMIAIPALALLRAYGNGRGYELWGVFLIPATGRTIGWLEAPADMLHSPLAWAFFALIAGHVAMALVHGLVRRDGVLRRMT